jgi:uncharacterized protein (DUF1015 family)
VTRAQAAALAAGNPLSFLHVTRSDIDLPPDTDPHDPLVYAKAKDNLSLFRSEGSLLPEEKLSLFLYELTLDGRAQVGVVGCVHVDDYASQLIRKHETTRHDKEDDRTQHILTTNAHAEPVFLTYPTQPFIGQLCNEVTTQAPLYDFVANDGVRHRVWRVADPDPFVDGFRRTATAYIADGHHRCAGAWRAGVERRKANPKHTGDEEYNWFLAVLFPSSQLRILPYNRVVKDLNGLTPQAFLDAVARLGTLAPTLGPPPEQAGSVGVLVGGRWYRLTFDPGSVKENDPVGSLDVALLQEHVLGPILGIGDVRTDPRIDFVGGVRGPAELERRVAAGEAAVAFALSPVSVQQLMAIADAGAVMPPKSTWFEPKLLSGLFVHTLD